jgi:hypothetical protein
MAADRDIVAVGTDPPAERPMNAPARPKRHVPK